MDHLKSKEKIFIIVAIVAVICEVVFNGMSAASLNFI